MKKIIVTGGCGFIGSNFIKKCLKKGYTILNVDKITYAGNLDNTKDCKKNKNYFFLKKDIADPYLNKNIFKFEPDAIVHFAAESHVDRSIDSSSIFLKTNILGTFNLLEIVRSFSKKKIRFLHISTDEVYGDLGKNKKKFTINTKFNPSSPYSASKASADHLVSSWNRTYGLDTLIINCSNNYGPHQFPEKFIPLSILSLLQNKPIPVYGMGNQVRDWIFVEDHCDAIEKVLRRGRSGKTYLVGGNHEISNINLIKKIIKKYHKIMQIKKRYSFYDYIKFVKDRPGHDIRYSVDTSFISKQLKWRPFTNFDQGIEKTIKWYIKNPNWIKKVINKKDYKFKRMG
jgi:dTDP-glucose 4,6-dehydratase